LAKILNAFLFHFYNQQVTCDFSRLITRRSQVQILAPLPIKSRGYAEMRFPFFNPKSGRIFGLLPSASVAVSTGIGNDRGITSNSVGDVVKVIMFTVGCPRIVLKTEPDPLTIPPPIFRIPRFGLRDHLIYRKDQSFIFRFFQSPSLVPAKTGSAGVYRRVRVESSGGNTGRSST